MKKLLFALAILFACSSTEPQGNVFEDQGTALSGYDPVAYFKLSKASKGDPRFQSGHNGYTYLFASAEHKNLFDQNPGQFLPAYGGWCAYAVAESSTRMAPDPEMWKIQNGKLLLFYDDWITQLTGSLIDEWNLSPKGYESKADNNWELMVSN